jgi:hypothetical protein
LDEICGSGIFFTAPPPPLAPLDEELDPAEVPREVAAPLSLPPVGAEELDIVRPAEELDMPPEETLPPELLPGL